MWGASRYLCFPERPKASSRSSCDRKQRKNHTSKLHELALLLPLAPKTKKLTKKEILQYILHYIQYLQRHIDVAKALLKFHAINGEGGAGGLGRNATVGSARQRHVTPSGCPHSCQSGFGGTCRKPRKKKLTRASGKHNVQDDAPSPAFRTQQEAEKTCFLYRTQPYPKYELVFYDSSEEMDKDAPDPWLPAWTPEGSPDGSPLALGPPQIDNWSATGQPSEILGLSPSLFSSPGKLLTEQFLEDGSDYLTQALFEEVFLDPVSSPSACGLDVPLEKGTPAELPEDLCDSHSLCLSSASLGHLSLSEDSSEGLVTDMDTELVWRQQDNPADPKSASDEDGDRTWTPTRRASALPAARRKGRRARADGRPVKLKNKKAPCSTQPKKKCVNGFIMFCRMNRKQYIRACPGTASTTATKQLAQLWREMTEQERRPYSIKARRFSRQHNRIVKQESSSSEDEDWGVPKPFYQLLADRAQGASQPAAQLPSRHR
uniref:Basic helix-loop-helix and HMG-box containing 1 n=1 Tax=Pipistrellus kuhlii TaxID=59472 RepID=A0A7J7S041_PIPKU|nr:basic helix-loop-helix and HMG-box containing 1 [Pipistrellus kuhlii]